MINAIWETIKLGFFFLLVMAPWNSAAMMSTYIYKQVNLDLAGPLNLISNYVFFILALFLAPWSELSFKNQMTIGVLGTLINVSSGLVLPLLPSKGLAYCYLTFSGVCAGVGNGYLWVAQGGYMRQIARSTNKKGTLQAIFNGFMACTLLIAGLCAYFIFGYFTTSFFFTVLTVITVISAGFNCLFLRNFDQKSSQRSINYVHIQNLQENFNESGMPINPILDSLKNMWQYFPTVKYVAPIMFLDGLALGIMANQVLRLIPQVADEGVMDKETSFIVLCLGIGALFGALLGGWLCDCIGLYFTGCFMVFFVVLCAIFSKLCIEIPDYNYVCISGVMWGFSYYIMQGWIFVIILKLYGGRLEAFSFNKIIHSISFCGVQIIYLIGGQKLPVGLFLIMVGACIVATLWGINKQNYDNESYSTDSQEQGSEQQYPKQYYPLSEDNYSSTSN